MCRNFKLETVMGNTQACAASMVAWFFGSTCIPQISVRVKQLSDRITMWSEHFLAFVEPSDRVHVCYDLFGFGGTRDPLVSGRRKAPTHFWTVRSSI